MGLYTHSSTVILWHDVIQLAENRCSVKLDQHMETYLVSLLIRYSNKPEVAQEIFAKSFLKALQQQQNLRQLSMQTVGDGCLLYAGLFPRAAEKKHVKISYFVDLGRSAYASISKEADDLYSSLAIKFVVLMDILQSINHPPDLLPLEAYEQWSEVGSQRALKILQEYAAGLPIKK